MSKEKRIYEKSPTGTIRSRKPLDYGNEKIEEQSTKPHCIGPDGVEHNEDIFDAIHYDIQHRVRREVLNELWSANKVTYDGHWYVKLADAINIIGDYNDLEENESLS
jgi:hypothetical protein